MQKQIVLNASPFNKVLIFYIGETCYDISDQVPENVWNIGDRVFPLHPIRDWEMRIELRKIFIEYFKENIDKNIDEKDIIF